MPGVGAAHGAPGSSARAWPGGVASMRCIYRVCQPLTSRRGRRGIARPLTAGLVLFAALAGWGAARDSQTWDEAMSVAAGFRQSDLGDFSVLWENPPLLGWVVYAPYTLTGVRHPALAAGAAGRLSPFDYGRQFLYDTGNSHRRVLILARLAVLIVSLAAVAVVIWWAYLLHGRPGAWIAAVCAACEPSWLAHGRTAAFDGLATATIAMTLFGCARLLERPSWGLALGTGAVMGLALASKRPVALPNAPVAPAEKQPETVP